ncbi:MAG: hypothetical protein ACYTFK_01525 [Planctomycetota bacterium]|jgi:uncharacterized protein YggE
MYCKKSFTIFVVLIGAAAPSLADQHGACKTTDPVSGTAKFAAGAISATAEAGVHSIAATAGAAGKTVNAVLASVKVKCPKKLEVYGYAPNRSGTGIRWMRKPVR